MVDAARTRYPIPVSELTVERAVKTAMCWGVGQEAVLISIWLDRADQGDLRRRVSYEPALE